MEKNSIIDLQFFYPLTLKIIKIYEESEQIKIIMKSQKHSHSVRTAGMKRGYTTQHICVPFKTYQYFKRM